MSIVAITVTTFRGDTVVFDTWCDVHERQLSRDEMVGRVCWWCHPERSPEHLLTCRCQTCAPGSKAKSKEALPKLSPVCGKTAGQVEEILESRRHEKHCTVHTRLAIEVRDEPTDDDLFTTDDD